MTKVVMKEKKPIIHFEDLMSWEEYECCGFDEVFPIDVEIHIVS